MRNASRLILLAVIFMSAGCASLIETASVASDAGDIRRCQDLYRGDADRAAYETCIDRSLSGGDARLSGL